MRTSCTQAKITMRAILQKLRVLSVRTLTVVALLYVTFVLPVGPFTLFGHVSRIASTPEAHEFLDSVVGGFRHMGQALTARVKEELTPGTSSR
jgi:hypothetical protein